MKKKLTSLLAIIFILLVISPAAFASDMKEVRNDNEHYSFLIPNDFKFQAIKIENPNSDNLSMIAVNPNSGSTIYVKKFNKALFLPIETWTNLERETFIQGVKMNESFPNTLKESGEKTINYNTFLWVKFSDIKQETIVYTCVHNNLLYNIGFIYPVNERKKMMPKITASINSFNFNDISPNWYWVESNMYIDLNDISTYKESLTNTIYKRVSINFTQSAIKDNKPDSEFVVDFKTENNINYYRPISYLTYGSNQQLLTPPFNFYSVNQCSDMKWIPLTPEHSLTKISNLLLEQRNE